jgi:hypothetical protein
LNHFWQSEGQAHPCIARLVAEARAVRQTGSSEPAPDYTVLSVDELLTRVHPLNQREIEKILLGRLHPADVDRYAAAFATDNPVAWEVALHCLIVLDRAAPFYEPVLEQVVTYLETAAEQAAQGWRRRILRRILLQLPAAMTLPIARRWFDEPRWYLQVVADHILEAHATTEDIPRCRARLVAALGTTPYDSEAYRVCSALDILARFPDIGPLPEVEAAFIQTGYAYARVRAARAMHMNAPAWFAETYGYECLWDCEDEIWQLGCEIVPLAHPGARERLQALVDDPWEEESLREAAARRLAPA